MAAFPLNPDLSTSYGVPGIYGYISTTGTAPSAQNRRVLILSYKTSAGTAPAGIPIRLNSEQDAVTYTGKGSGCTRIYRAIQSVGGAGAEIFACPLLAPSGTAQTRLIKIMAAPASGVLDASSTAAAAAGIATIWVAGYRADAIVANGDTYATIATNLKNELLKVEDYLPCTVTSSTDTITLTARHAALTSADFPIVVTFEGSAMSIAASPGTLTYATNAGAGGTSTLYAATQSVATTINNADTPAVIAAAQRTDINNANALPVTAAIASPATGVVTLFYQNDRVVNWLATAITPSATITTTLTVAVGNHAAGLPSSSTPSLSTALTNIQGVSDTAGAFKVWVTDFTGAGSYITDAAFTQVGSATSYANMGTISSHIEQQGGGRVCKGQVVVFGDTRALATAGALPVGTSPALTASPRYFMGFIPACPQQGVEMAARMAARIISSDYLPQNYAGMVLPTDAKVPLLGIHPAVAMTDSDANSAMLSYYMTPIRMNPQGQYTIVSGRTTAKPGASMDVRFVFWGTIRTVDYFRDDLREYLGGVLKGKSLKVYSEPSTSNTVTPESIVDLCVVRAKTWEGLDYFDGVDRLRDYFQGGVNVSAPSRVDLLVPCAEPVPLEQVSAVFQQVA